MKTYQRWSAFAPFFWSQVRRLEAIHIKEGIWYDKHISTSTFISVLQSFNDLTWAIGKEEGGRFRCPHERRAKSLGVTAATWTSICDTIISMTLPRNWELSTRRVSERGSDDTDLERLELSNRSIDLHCHNSISVHTQTRRMCVNPPSGLSIEVAQ